MLKKFRPVICITLVLILRARGDAQVTFGRAIFGSNNAFPFNSDGFGANPRYQQVYKGSLFGGPTTIGSLTFFDNAAPARFETADYTVRLSTSKFGVNSLDTVNLDSNPGADAQLFATVHLSGATGSSFTITGTPFNYNPSSGDLLIDITRANAVIRSGMGALDSMNGTAGGIFSRADNFGEEFNNWGLVTRFNFVPEPSTLILLVGSVGLMSARRFRMR